MSRHPCSHRLVCNTWCTPLLITFGDLDRCLPHVQGVIELLGSIHIIQTPADSGKPTRVGAALAKVWPPPMSHCPVPHRAMSACTPQETHLLTLLAHLDGCATERSLNDTCLLMRKIMRCSECSACSSHAAPGCAAGGPGSRGNRYGCTAAHVQPATGRST